MATRHKAIKASLDVGTAVEWNDDHIADFTDEVTLYEDFITPVITTKWDVTTNAAGVAGVFMETHPKPDLALSDGPNSWPLNHARELVEVLYDIDCAVKAHGFFEDNNDV